VPGHQGLHPHTDHLQEDINKVLRGWKERRAQAQVLPVSNIFLPIFSMNIFPRGLNFMCVKWSCFCLFLF